MLHKPLIKVINEYDSTFSKYLFFSNPKNLKWRKFLIISEFSCHGIPWLIASIVLTYIWPQEKYIVDILIGLILNIVILAILKASCRRVRPFYMSKKRSRFDKNSFPSGHASWAAYLSLLFKSRLLGVWSFFVSLSRVLNGQNFVGDVVAGLIIGPLIYKLQFSFCNGLVNEITKWCLSFILFDSDDYDDDYIRS